MHNIMEIITLGNHVVRKALLLSLNEMAVLCDIVKMSNSPKYNFTCRKSKEKIADWLDLSRQTVHTIINTLKVKSYIVNFEEGLRPSDLIYELNTASDEIGVYIKNNDVEMISKKISEIMESISVKNLDTTVKKFDTDVKNLYIEVSKNFTQDISKKKDKEKINNIPSESLEVVLPLHTSDMMYESKLDNIDANCTIPSSDITIPVSKPKKKSKSNFQSNPDRYIWIDKKLKEWNDNSPSDMRIFKKHGDENNPYYAFGNIYDKYGDEKASAYLNFIISKGDRGRNKFSLITPKNQEEFEHFYQEPEQEQPRYLEDKRFSYMERSWGKGIEEPTVNVLLNEDSYYAAMEWFYSQQSSGNDLVKAVRARVKELNNKYNKY